MASLTETQEPRDPRQESEALGRDTARVLAELERLVHVAGLRNDPTLPLLKLLFSSQRLQWRLHDQAIRYFHDASDRLDRQYHETIKKAELSIKQSEQALDAKRTGIVDQLAPKIASAVETAVRQRVKILKIRTLAGWGVAVLALALLPCAFTYTAGLSTGRNEGENAAHAMQAAMGAGPDAAMDWALLMADNNPSPALAACKKAISTDANGRRYCSMLVWLDPVAAPTQQ